LRDQLLDALLVRRQPAELLEHPFHKDAARDRFKLRILDARRLLEFCAGLGIGGDQLGSRPERREVAADGARFEQLEAVVLLLNVVLENTPEGQWRRGQGGRVTTHSYVGYLAERLVSEVRWLLVLGLLEVDGDDFVGDVALFGYQGHAACASGEWDSVKLECHCASECRG